MTAALRPPLRRINIIESRVPIIIDKYIEKLITYIISYLCQDLGLKLCSRRKSLHMYMIQRISEVQKTQNIKI